MERLAARTLLAVAFVACCAVPVSAYDYAWWLTVEFAPTKSAIESIPLRDLDPSWTAASRLREDDLPPEAFVRGESLRDHGGSFEVSADLDGDRKAEKALVGVYRAISGEVGEFLLILDGGHHGRWKKRALFTTAGKAGFSVLFYRNKRLLWASCMECDSSCEVRSTAGEWTLDCGSCCDEP